MKVSATVKSAFYHGNKPFAEGDVGQFTKAEAHDLEKSGLIEVGGEVEDEQADTKMQEPVENKMEKPLSNKSIVKK